MTSRNKQSVNSTTRKNSLFQIHRRSCKPTKEAEALVKNEEAQPMEQSSKKFVNFCRSFQFLVWYMLKLDFYFRALCPLRIAEEHFPFLVI